MSFRDNITRFVLSFQARWTYAKTYARFDAIFNPQNLTFARRVIRVNQGPRRNIHLELKQKYMQVNKEYKESIDKEFGPNPPREELNKND